jgi:hypothetical protein
MHIGHMSYWIGQRASGKTALACAYRQAKLAAHSVTVALTLIFSLWPLGNVA